MCVGRAHEDNESHYLHGLGRVDELFVDPIVAQDFCKYLGSPFGTKLETCATNAFLRIRQQSLVQRTRLCPFTDINRLAAYSTLCRCIEINKEPQLKSLLKVDKTTHSLTDYNESC